MLRESDSGRGSVEMGMSDGSSQTRPAKVTRHEERWSSAQLAPSRHRARVPERAMAKTERRVHESKCISRNDRSGRDEWGTEELCPRNISRYRRLKLDGYPESGPEVRSSAVPV